MTVTTDKAGTGVPDGLERKSAAPGGLLVADEAQGIVEALVSVTGIPDEVKDIIEPGAYAETLATRKPKGIFGHDWGQWTARTLDAKELMPGDPALPPTTRDGKPWPAAAGALYVKAQFNLETQAGRDAFSNVRFFGPECEWSIGYDVPHGKGTRGRDGIRRIKALRCFEYSPVLFGAAPLSGTLTVKAVTASTTLVTGDGDPNGWATNEPDDPITAEADADDPDMQALHAKAIEEMNAQPQGWDAIDVASMIDPGEEEITSDTEDALQAADTRRQGMKAISVADGGTVPETKDSDAGSLPAGVSDKPWSDFSASDYTNAQWYRACLIHTQPGDPDTTPKDASKLPVSEPDGTLNRNAVHAAAGVLAGARGGVDATPAQKKTAAARLRSLYKKIGQTPPSSLEAKVLTSADVTGTPPTGPSGPVQLRARETGASGSTAAYSLGQWHDATLIHKHDAGRMPENHDDCALPVAAPDGTLDLGLMHTAAQKLGGGDLDAGDDQKQTAATALLMLFRRAGEQAPAFQVKTAGQDLTPADARATERLKQWYEHGGGAAQIGWGTPGDFGKCVTIAGKHMDPAKAKGYCQLRHHAATGFYAGHAPSEEAAHSPARAAAAAITGKKSIIDPASIGGYDPSLETGAYAGCLPSESKAITIAGAPLEEQIDAVTAAVTAALGGTLPGPGGMPRRIVAVNGTWADHAIATACDTWDNGAAPESFRVPYQVGDSGEVTLGDPEPVILNVAAEAGTKGLGDGDTLSLLPVLVEYVTGYVRRGLTTETKSGRVLSDMNARLLRGAVDQLIAVLNSAGIAIDVPGGDKPDAEDQALSEQGSTPLYLPDTTAPAAQVSLQKSAPEGEQKVILDPRDMAGAARITAFLAERR